MDLYHVLKTQYAIVDTNNEIRESGAEGRSRTDTSFKARWILSPVRLPISPLRHSGSLFKNYRLSHIYCQEKIK